MLVPYGIPFPSTLSKLTAVRFISEYELEKKQHEVLLSSIAKDDRLTGQLDEIGESDMTGAGSAVFQLWKIRKKEFYKQSTMMQKEGFKAPTH